MCSRNRASDYGHRNLSADGHTNLPLIFYLLSTLDILDNSALYWCENSELDHYHAYPGTTITVLWLPEFNRSFGYTLYPVRGASVGYNVEL
jgi:hypothetical protein